MAPVKPEHNGKQKNEKEDECKGKDKPIFDRCLERRNANLLLIPEKNEVGMVASIRPVLQLSHLVQGFADAFRSLS